MNLFDYCKVFEERENGVLLLNFEGTAYLIEDVIDGEVDLDSGEYWLMGVDGESEEELMSYVSTFDDGEYVIHCYEWLITDWDKDEGVMWSEYDAGGTDAVRVRVKNKKVV